MYSCAKLLRRSERARNEQEKCEAKTIETKKKKRELSYFGHAQRYKVEEMVDEDCPTGKLYISNK